jgi:hypothetical protein
MNINTAAPAASVPLDALDRATDALDKAEAILSTVANAYDDGRGFSGPDRTMWLALLAALDLVGAARGSLATDAPSVLSHA